jgi:hypothetical protein
LSARFGYRRHILLPAGQGFNSILKSRYSLTSPNAPMPVQAARASSRKASRLAESVSVWLAQKARQAGSRSFARMAGFMRKNFGRGRWKRSRIAPKRGDLGETKAAMRNAPIFVERLIFLQRIAKHRLRFDRVFPGQSQCFGKGGVCLANAFANPDIDIPCRLQMGRRAIEIIAPKRQIAEG